MGIPTKVRYRGCTSAIVRTALAIVAATACAGNAVAETQPSFDLFTLCDRAERIVSGTLDDKGLLVVDQMLSGASEHGASIQLPGTSARPFLDAMKPVGKTAIEAVVFLDKDNRPMLGDAGIVGLSEQDVYLVHPDLDKGMLREGPIKPAKHPTITREMFLKATRLTISQTAERRRLAALPPAVERAKSVLTFLQQLPVPAAGDTILSTQPDRHLQKLAEALRPLNRLEEQVILEALTGTPDPAWRIRLLKLAAGIPLSNNAFETAAGWISVNNPRELREAAVVASAAINNDWATERLIPLLSLEDASFPVVLGAIGRRSDEFYQGRRNPKMIDALLILMDKLRQTTSPAIARRRDELTYELMNAVQYHLHPRLLPSLVEWAQRQDESSSRVCSFLKQATGLEFEPKKLKPLRQWWEQSRAILETDYDLSTTEGLSEWLNAFQAADKITRDMLNRLWLFERTIPEERLLIEAQSGDELRAETARTVLANLWQFGRLTSQARSTIVEKFLPIRLRETPSPGNASGGRELILAGNREFPFPESAWIEFRTEWKMSDTPNTFGGGGWNSKSLSGDGEIQLGSLGGGRHFGEPEVSAVLFIRQFDHRSQEVDWTQRVEFGPLKLRRLPGE